MLYRYCLPLPLLCRFDDAAGSPKAATSGRQDAARQGRAREATGDGAGTPVLSLSNCKGCSVCVCVLCVLSVSLCEGAIGAQVAVDNSSSERLSSRFVATPTSHFVFAGASGEARKYQAGDDRARGAASAEDRARAREDGDGGQDSRREEEPRPSPGAGMYMRRTKRTRANRRRTHREGVHPPLRCDPAVGSSSWS